ncbi:unnamed protein product [Sphagnum balticum]
MEGLLSTTEEANVPEVMATIDLGLEQHQVIAIHAKEEQLLSDALIDLKDKCMQVLGAHLLRHSLPLEEDADTDLLDETLSDVEEEEINGAAPPKRQK